MKIRYQYDDVYNEWLRTHTTSFCARNPSQEYRCIVHNQSEHEREPTTKLTCWGGSQSGDYSGGRGGSGGGDGGDGDSRSRWTFEFANVIICHSTRPVVYPMSSIAQTTICLICNNPMVLVFPTIQVASIRVPFQLVDTIAIFTIYFVRVC